MSASSTRIASRPNTSDNCKNPKLNWSSHTIFISVVYAAMIFVVSLVAQWLVYHYLLQVEGDLRWIGAGIAGLSTGLFVWRINSIRQKELVAQHARMKAIGEVNHHIRNCLQILVCENFARPQLSEDSLYAIKRIDWTLKNILPSLVPPDAYIPQTNRLTHSPYKGEHSSANPRYS